MTNTFAQMEIWQARPLCCRYLSLHFDQLPVQVLADRGTSQILSVTWALGTLSDDQSEVLGAWAALTPDSMFWRGVFDELRVRGVEEISLLAHTTPERLSMMLGVGEAIVVSNGLPDVPLRLRAVARRGDKIVERLRENLSRAISRHDRFLSPNAATSFVAETLARAELNQSASGAVLIAGPVHRAVRVNARRGMAVPRR